MKISTMTTRDLLDRMGSETTDAQAEAMRELLELEEFTDTNEISDERWVAMIAEAVEKAK